MSDIAVHSAALIVPYRSNAFAAGYSVISHPIYKSSSSVISYGMKLSEKLATGALFELAQTNINGYSKSFSMSGGVGLMIVLHPLLHTGLQVKNLRRKALSQTTELPLVYELGIGYDVSEQVFVGAEVAMVSHGDANIDLSLLYQPHPHIHLIAGAELNPTMSKLGLLIPFKFGSIGVHSAFHQQLGVSFGLLLIYKKPKKQE